jgi:hypothetical protein
VSVRKHKKENVKVHLENWLVSFIWQKMQISHARLLIQHSGSMYREKKFAPNLIQIIIDIVTLGCRPNIDLELHKTFTRSEI